jgi:hypothetical protein
MGKVEDYRQTLRALPLSQWDRYLRENSNLPGPRGNLELAAAVADEAPARWLISRAYCDANDAAGNTPDCFVACCAVQGLGRLAADGDVRAAAIIKRQASDARWRIRESVAMALQRIGDADMTQLLEIAAELAADGPLEQRAAAAGLAEPRLLKDEAYAPEIVAILETITRSMARAPDRRSDAFKALRQGMGYCWSVVIAAYPDAARPAFERWLVTEDKDVRWMLKENLKKNRLQRLDPDWVATSLAKLA